MGSADISIRTRNEKKADDIAEALRQDNISLQTSGRIMAENLEVLRGKMAEIFRTSSLYFPEPISEEMRVALRCIRVLSRPADQVEV